MTCRQHRNLGHSSTPGINPEAPTDGLRDPRPLPPDSDWWWAAVAALVAVILVGMLTFASWASP
jgi:hypothetical protein